MLKQTEELLDILKDTEYDDVLKQLRTLGKQTGLFEVEPLRGDYVGTLRVPIKTGVLKFEFRLKEVLGKTYLKIKK